MMVYYDKDLTKPEPRIYPYGPADETQSGFVDFIAHPELIESSLEDFRPYAQIGAVHVFYDFLRWINGPTSELATCDCALSPPDVHTDTNSTLPFRVHGRVFILFRRLLLNTSMEHSDWLCGRMMVELEDVDAGWPAVESVVGFTKQRALHVEISRGIRLPSGELDVAENDPGFGYHTMLTFFAYGNSEAEAWVNAERAFRNVRVAAERTSESTRHGLESK